MYAENLLWALMLVLIVVVLFRRDCYLFVESLRFRPKTSRINGRRYCFAKTSLHGSQVRFYLVFELEFFNRVTYVSSHREKEPFSREIKRLMDGEEPKRARLNPHIGFGVGGYEVNMNWVVANDREFNRLHEVFAKNAMSSLKWQQNADGTKSVNLRHQVTHLKRDIKELYALEIISLDEALSFSG